MKKIRKALFLFTLGAFTLNSCEDVPEPYPVPGGGSGDTSEEGVYINQSFATSLGVFSSQSLSGELSWKNDYSSAMITGYQDFDGDGTKENKAGVTLLVSEPFSLAASKGAYVTFTHAINYSKTTLAEDHKLVISKDYNGDATTATWEELPFTIDNTGSSFDFVSAGQIAIPAAYIGQSNVVVALKHTAHDSYSSTWEVQSFKVLEGEAQNDTNDDVYVEESFATSLGSFNSQSEEGEITWINDYSSAMITGYRDFGTGSKENRPGVTYLISPALDLSASQGAYVTFDHAINYSRTTLAEDHKLVISKDYNGDVKTATWEELPLTTSNTGTSFTFVSAGQIEIPAAYIGQSNVVVALKHIAHDDYSSTWEVKNFKVLEGEAGGNTPDIPVDGPSVTVTFASLRLENGEDLTTHTLPDGTVLTFAQEDGRSIPKYYTSGTAARMYANNSLTVTAGSKTIAQIVLNCTDPLGTTSYNGNDTMYGEANGNRLTPVRTGDTVVTFSGIGASTFKIVNAYNGTSGGTQLRLVSLVITYAE